MSQYKDIPQPTDQRNVSQSDILTNYRYLSTPINVAAGVPPGILPVDHQASGDNVANPKDGFHLQVSYINRSTPTNLVNAVNGQLCDSIDYSTLSVGPAGGQKHFYNGHRDYPQSYVYAMARFSVPGDTPTLIGNSFNIASIVRNSAGDYTVNFTTPLFDANYIPIITVQGNSGGVQEPLGSYRTVTAASFELIVFDTKTATNSKVDPPSVGFIIVEYF